MIDWSDRQSIAMKFQSQFADTRFTFGSGDKRLNAFFYQSTDPHRSLYRKKLKVLPQGMLEYFKHKIVAVVICPRHACNM